MRTILILAAVIAAMVCLPSSGQAQSEGPWCAVVETGQGNATEICHFRSVEECRGHVIAGNRGNCIQNPRWPGWRNRNDDDDSDEPGNNDDENDSDD